VLAIRAAFVDREAGNLEVVSKVVVLQNGGGRSHFASGPAP
jgi:hypothetical protein